VRALSIASILKGRHIDMVLLNLLEGRLVADGFKSR